MKKLIVIAILFFIFFSSFPYTGISQGSVEGNMSEFQVIPDEAIRLRILANSDGEEDQELKRTIRDEVNKEITKWVEEIDDIEKARQLIERRIGNIEAIVREVLEEENAKQDFQIEYGEDIKFPDKVYGSFIYPAGEYEAILITLGEGKGANWWCVLFPPLCFLDFSNGTSVAEEDKQEEEEEKEEEKEDGVEVKFFLIEWFSGWFD